MKRTLTIIILAFLTTAFSPWNSYAQNVISYSYDAAGNRTSRMSSSPNVAQRSITDQKPVAVLPAKDSTGFREGTSSRYAVLPWMSVKNLSSSRLFTFLENNKKPLTGQSSDQKDERGSGLAAQQKAQEE